MPWTDESDAHQKLVGWLVRVLLSERSTLDPDMLRKPVLTAWEVRAAVDARVWQEHIPLDLRATIDEARLKREKARPREAYTARHELQIATPELIAQHLPLSDLLPVIQAAEQAMFTAAESSLLPESGSYSAAPVSRGVVASGLPCPPSRTSSVNGLSAVSSPRPLAVAR
jgi:hypothetical protein